MPLRGMIASDKFPQESSKGVLQENGGIAKDETLIMHFFQESLTGAAFTWYTNLESSRVHSWKGLMVAFVRK